ncbi:MAG TPA: hypothetical protein PLZ32_02565 [Saprospiraceae bacterium]|nr:hypothetical protein [Saprospiraceae bacterium]
MEKTFLILCLTCILSVFLSCKQEADMDGSMNYEDANYEGNQGSNKNVSYSNHSDNQGSLLNDYKKVEEKDPQGLLVSTIEMPINWRYEGPVIKGPNNLEISNKSRYPNGQHPIMSLEEAINYEIPNVINSIGFKITNSQMLDEINKVDQTYQNRLYSSGLTEKMIRSIGYDVVNNSGDKSFIVAKYIRFTVYYASFVSINYTLVSANENYIEAAKDGLLHMYSSRIYDEQFILAFNQNERFKEAQTNQQIAINGSQNQGSWEAHNQKMNQYRNETNGAISGVYNSSSSSFNRSNDMILNGLREEERIYNPYSGQQMAVPMGNQRYFVNPNNEVIGTDDAFINETQLNWNGGNYIEGRKQ